MHVAGQRVGLDLDDYAGQNTLEGLRARAAFALATSRTGALDPPLMGALILHRVPPEMMRNLHAKIQAHRVRVPSADRDVTRRWNHTL